MLKESIIAFSQAKAEPLWLQDLRQAAFDKLDSLALPKIERVKFHRWNLGDGTIAENEPSANVPDFTALGNNPKLVQVGTNTVLEQVPADLIDVYKRQGLGKLGSRDRNGRYNEHIVPDVLCKTSKTS